MDRSRHTVTKYLNDEKNHRAINNKLFKRLNLITDQLYEVELVKAQIERREPIIVGFFILQFAKLRKLELYYNFLKKFCDSENYEELEMDTDSLYLALSEENLEDIILPEKRNEWETICSRDCTDVVLFTRSMIKESRDYLKKIVATIERVTVLVAFMKS